MIEDIVSAIWEIIKDFILEVIFKIIETVIYSIGRLFLRLVTLGKYPKSYHLEKHENRICLTGAFVTFLICWAIVVYLLT
jgi:hypothetical protein